MKNKDAFHSSRELLRYFLSSQAHAATVIGHLATVQPSVCEALANDATITSLAGLLADASDLAFAPPSSRDHGLLQDAGFVVASVSGCLMNVSQGGGATALSRNAVAIRVIAKSMIGAGKAAARDADDQVALRCGVGLQ